jgi:uncharacterized protein YkwD
LRKRKLALVAVLALFSLAWAGIEPLSSWWNSSVGIARDVSIAINTELSESAVSNALEVEADILTYSNNARLEAGVPILARNNTLDMLALQHCSQMVRTSCLSHDGFDGRANLAFANGMLFVGENCAEGYRDGKSVVEGWMNSPGHRTNLLDSRFCYIGIAYEDGYSVQIFGGTS